MAVLPSGLTQSIVGFFRSLFQASLAAGAGVAGRCHPGRWSAHGRRRAARHGHGRRETISEVSPGAEPCQMVDAGR